MSISLKREGYKGMHRKAVNPTKTQNIALDSRWPFEVTTNLNFRQVLQEDSLAKISNHYCEHPDS